MKIFVRKLKLVKDEYWLSEQMKNELFYCEPLLKNDKNIDLINNFCVNEQTGKGLEYYLRLQAIADEKCFINRTYLVKDNETNELVGYFSLKAGMVSVNESWIGNEFDAIPGVELANFAVNSNYKQAHEEATGIGQIIFMDFILPICQRAAQKIGINFIYIFALPYPKLINYYQKLNFTRLKPKEEKKIHRHFKPRYDRGCIFMSRSLFTNEESKYALE